MANASSEYLITRPGTHHHLRKRDKPLRTYGRRRAPSEPDAEPPSKKPRLAAASEKGMQRDSAAIITAEPAGRRSESISSEPEPQTVVACTAGQSQANARKGSIMSYFKPAASRPQTSSPPPQPADAPNPEEPIRETISVTATTRRKPRLLKIRAIGVPSDSADVSDGEEKENEDVGDIGESRSPSPSYKNHIRNRNRQGLVVGRVEDVKSSGLVKSKTSSPVQTTLNISAQAAFSECKICDTVWNPLYPDDVRYHTKRHRALLRARMKKVEDEL